MKNKFLKYWKIWLPLLLLALFLFDLSLGSVRIPIDQTLTILLGGKPSNTIWTDIVIDFRLTKAITCILVGSGLSVGGLLMQTFFRNPLAGPDVLGLSSGASLAVAILIMVAGSQTGPFSSAFTLTAVASIGCALILLLVLIFARRVKDNTSILIIGLMIGAGTSSIVSVLQFTSSAENQQYFLIWTFGSLGNLSWSEIQMMGTVVILGILLSFRSIKSLNGWMLGDNYAISLGINLKRSRLLIIITACILTGAITAFCGPIAFVGIAVPHIGRLLADTANHKILIPIVLLCGSVIMLFCDILTQLPGTSYVLPINAITAFIGAPVVIWVILKSKKIRV